MRLYSRRRDASRSCASNTPDEQYSAKSAPVYQINYLRCIFCGMHRGVLPLRALTMTNDFEIPLRQFPQDDDHRGAGICWSPLHGMLDTPHPMVEGKRDIDYYRGDVTGPTAAQVDWVAARRPDDSP